MILIILMILIIMSFFANIRYIHHALPAVFSSLYKEKRTLYVSLPDGLFYLLPCAPELSFDMSLWRAVDTLLYIYIAIYLILD